MISEITSLCHQCRHGVVGVQGTELPAPLVLGSTSCSGTMSGSHLEPTIAGSWNAPAGQASGSIELRPTVRPHSAHPLLPHIPLVVWLIFQPSASGHSI